MSDRKIVAFRNFDADLFEINFRLVLNGGEYSHITIVGDRETVRRVPKSPQFSTYQISKQVSIKTVLELARLIHAGNYDAVFYGSNDEGGVNAILFDLFVAYFSWKAIWVANRLKLRCFRSRLDLLLAWIPKLIKWPRYLKVKNKVAKYVLGFSDELLYSDKPVNFEFETCAPSLVKKTLADETRSCFYLSEGDELLFKLTERDLSGVVLGVSNEPAKASGNKEGFINLELLQAGVVTKSIKQDCKTFLEGWNDHRFDLAPTQASDDIILKCHLKGGGEKVALSFPFIQKRFSEKNIIVIILDGVNKDYLGAYSSDSRQYSENIDGFFNGKLKYQSAFSQEIWTRPTFASMMTSYYPSHHQLADKNFFMQLPPEIPTLAEQLRESGYHTAAYVSHRLANQLYGFSRGFDRFVWRQTNEKPSYDAHDITYFALETLAENQTNNLFMFLHYFDTHLPFFPRSPYCYNGRKKDFRNASEVYLKAKQNRFFTDEDRNLINQTAQNKVREIDRILEPLFLKLKSKDYAENTTVILTSDHGSGRLHADAILDNGILRLVDEIVEVPLLVSPAGNIGIQQPYRGIENLVEASVDLYPTVLDLAGVDPEHSPYSQSYIPSPKSYKKKKELAISEAIYFDTYQLIVRTSEDRYFLKCKKSEGSFTVDSQDTDREEMYSSSAMSMDRLQKIAEGSELSRKFKRLREELGLAEFNSLNPLRKQLLTDRDSHATSK